MFGPEWRKAATLIEGVENRVGVENSALRWTMRESHLAMISECSGKISDPSPGVPAYVVFYEDGGVSLSSHFNHGLAQNPSPDVPCEIAYFQSGLVKRTQFCVNGRQNDPADGIPAIVEYHPEGMVKCISHFKDGNLIVPPDESPAYIEYNKDGTVHHGLLPNGVELTAEEANAMIAEARINECKKLLGPAVVLAKSSCVVASGARKPRPRTL